MKKRYRKKIAALALALSCAGAGLAQLSVSGSQPVTILNTAPAAQSIAALNGTAAISLAGQAGAAVALTGTWTATLTPELSFDGGSTWVSTFVYQPGSGQNAATVTSNGSYTILCSAGASHARVRASAFTGGSITASLRSCIDWTGHSVNRRFGWDDYTLSLTDSAGRLVAAGSSGVNITTATTTAVKGTAGVLRRVVIGTGVASATVKLFNVAAGSCSGTPASGASGVVTVPSTLGNAVSLEINQAFSAGICVVTSAATNVIVIFD